MISQSDFEYTPYKSRNDNKVQIFSISYQELVLRRKQLLRLGMTELDRDVKLHKQSDNREESLGDK